MPKPKRAQAEPPARPAPGTEVRCPAEDLVGLLGGRWKVPILWHLFGRDARRFGELRRSLAECTAKVLTQQLRQMERDGLVRRKVYAEVPPRVEYSLTKLGKSVQPVVEAMCAWEKCRTRK
ncbi:MAG TPA: helix-turn-helix domain-containing protein [Tepidisphaeraceae bacterium]|nr:helix-turn-helix domain-containing protein [Tepidisphaeraceae bacterium]